MEQLKKDDYVKVLEPTYHLNIKVGDILRVSWVHRKDAYFGTKGEIFIARHKLKKLNHYNSPLYKVLNR